LRAEAASEPIRVQHLDIPHAERREIAARRVRQLGKISSERTGAAMARSTP